ESAAFRDAGVDVDLRVCRSEDELAEIGGTADGVLTMGVGLSRPTLAMLDRCRAIVSASHGTNHIDVAAATELGIPVSNTYFCHEDVANHTFLLLLAAARKLTLLDRELSAGHWRRDLLGGIPPIYGQTLGLVGFGHIGAAVTRRALAFGLTVLVTDPYVDPAAITDAGARPASLDQVLRASDFVSLHVPYSEATYHLIGAEQLGAMKPTAFLINTARGPLVDEPALIAALRAGTIAGAGLDVFEREPTEPDNPLLSMPNVVKTPHSAGTSIASLPSGRRQAAAALAVALDGTWPPHVVNPEVRGRLRSPLASGS
ncbi:MAG: C-terminal binding protein, partial [Chloroflexi bacterium]|nr:C-terminal binding protein [Chloroflexota bacterium]